MFRTSLITVFVTVIVAASAGAQDTTSVSASSPSTTLKFPASYSMGVRQASTFRQAPQPERDSRLNGFLIGFVAGAVPGIMLGMGINSYCNNESSSDCPWAIPIVGGLFGLAGGGIGYAIDGAIHQSPSFGRPRPGPGVKFSVRF